MRGNEKRQIHEQEYICLPYFSLHKNAVLVMRLSWLFWNRISLHSCRWRTPVTHWSSWQRFISELQGGLNTSQWDYKNLLLGHSDLSPGRTKPRIFNIKNVRSCPFICCFRFKWSTSFLAVNVWPREEQPHIPVEIQDIPMAISVLESVNIYHRHQQLLLGMTSRLICLLQEKQKCLKFAVYLD